MLNLLQDETPASFTACRSRYHHGKGERHAIEKKVAIVTGGAQGSGSASLSASLAAEARAKIMIVDIAGGRAIAAAAKCPDARMRVGGRVEVGGLG